MGRCTERWNHSRDCMDLGPQWLLSEIHTGLLHSHIYFPEAAPGQSLSETRILRLAHSWETWNFFWLSLLSKGLVATVLDSPTVWDISSRLSHPSFLHLGVKLPSQPHSSSSLLQLIFSSTSISPNQILHIFNPILVFASWPFQIITYHLCLLQGADRKRHYIHLSGRGLLIPLSSLRLRQREC